eukprot:07499_6
MARQIARTGPVDANGALVARSHSPWACYLLRVSRNGAPIATPARALFFVHRPPQNLCRVGDFKRIARHVRPAFFARPTA